MNINKPKKIIHELIAPQKYFPGNAHCPLLIYKHVFSDDLVESVDKIQALLNQNQWGNAWVDRIYDYHHYHSNTHEVLIIIDGTCDVQLGGETGSIHTVILGDMIVIPAGVAHKSLKMSDNFKCIGAYPDALKADMQYGKQEEYIKAIENIKKVNLPKNDPVFGEKGLLFNYWK